MMNRWGNDDHGPGGDPSWLGGGDRDGEEPQAAGSWSSDFASDDQAPDSDFARSDSDLGGSRNPQAAEQMAPRFGHRDGQDPLPSGRDEDSPWASSFTGKNSKGSGNDRSTLSKILGVVVPLIMILAFVFIALKASGSGGGFGGFSSWWFVMLIGIPLIRRGIRMIRKKFDD